jgi:tripartite-type tricarboxylate transporter receptor subunit TctC
MTNATHDPAVRTRPQVITRRDALALLAAVPLATRANEPKWPARPVRLVVPYVAGGGGDVVARLYAQRLSTTLGQPVVVDNKPGADGIIGCEIVARSAPDGYTILLDGPSFTHNVAVGKRMPYVPTRDFVPVVHTSIQQLLLVVHPASGIRNLADLLERARKDPGKLNYASTSNSTALPMELFKSMANVDIKRISYKGAAPATTAMLTQEVDVSFVGAGTVGAQVKAGKLRAIAIGDSARSEAFPDVPTVAEAGVKDFRAIHWTGLFMPRGTPAEIVAVVNREARAAAADPAFRQRILDANLEPPMARNAPADWARFVDEEIRLWTNIVKVAGLSEDK